VKRSSAAGFARGDRLTVGNDAADTETPAPTPARVHDGKTLRLFAEGSSPASTMEGCSVDVRFLLVTLMSIRLTLCGRQRLLGET